MKRRNFISVAIAAILSPLGLLKQSKSYSAATLPLEAWRKIDEKSCNPRLWRGLVAIHDCERDRKWTREKGWEPWGKSDAMRS